MASAGMKQMQGEKRVDYIARVQAEQAREAAERAKLLKPKRKRKSRAKVKPESLEDRQDDLGESRD